MDRDFPPKAITDEFLDVLANPERDPVFAGGRITSLDFSDQILTTHSGAPIDLRGATIDGDLDLTDATVEVPLLLGQAAIIGSIEAAGATFQAPVDLAKTSVGKRLHLHDSTFNGGVAAHDLDAGFADARALSAAAPLVFDGAAFNANVQFARSRFEGEVSFEDADFDRLIDFTGIEADSAVSFAGAAVDGDATFIAATIDGDLSLRDLHVSADTTFDHAVLNGDVDAVEASFDGELQLRDVRCRGKQLAFDRATIGERADFAYLNCSRGSVSMAGTVFEGETWFTHASFGGAVSLSDAQFKDITHLRDAEFHEDLAMRTATFESQSFLHGSTISGDLDAEGATFEHFQFSATVKGNADFRDCRFDAHGLFKNSEVGGEALFDAASFAGNPDFSESRFKGPVSFQNTEFLVEPTFEGTRFAVDPELDAAVYPQDSSRNLDDRRRNIIVARPEELQNQGLTFPIEAVTDDAVIPAAAYELIQLDINRVRAITHALNALDGRDWYTLFERPIELSRTAVSDLDDDGRIALIYGVGVEPAADGPGEFLDEARLVGVYQIQKPSEQIQFRYLDPAVENIDYLIAVPADDSAFESGVSVGVRSEFQKAIFRRQVLQMAILERGDAEATFFKEFLPVLVGFAQIENGMD